MRRVVFLALVACLVLGGDANAGVRVVEDEVIFTLRAPGAQEVYLVGDFNNWNPTVEPMEKSGDVFEIWLFLVPGTYRYKFVVDGEWTVDPDNPGDVEKGSYLTLEERAGGYALDTDEPEPEKPVATLTPSVRYIGEFRYDDEDGEADQIADLYLSFERTRLRGRADLQSLDHTWRASPPSADIDVARAFAEATLGALALRGFENDTTWTSRGPVTLVGDDGVFGYNTGFDRHGVAFELSPSQTIVARVLYVDRIGEAVHADPSIDAVAVADFAAGVASDTTAYAFSESDTDADQAAVELAVDASDFALGYVKRTDRGLHPGVLADISREGTALPATVYRTREERNVALYWLRLKKLQGFDVSAAYGRASSSIDLLGSGETDAYDAGSLSVGRASGEADAEIRFMDSDRVSATLSRAIAGVLLCASWDYTSFDFKSRVYAPASARGARVHRSRASLEWKRAAWSVSLRGRFTDQSYGSAPEALHVDTPALNPWLYGRDDLDVGDLVSLNDDRHTDVAATVEFIAGEEGAAGAPWVPRSAGLDIYTTATGAFDAVELIVSRARARFEHRENYYAYVDARLATYDEKDTFASGWVEVGYRRGVADVNIGFGFDPVVYDPVVGEYGDIGRLRLLRHSLETGAVRANATAIGERLIALERELEATNAIKLECTIRF